MPISNFQDKGVGGGGGKKGEEWRKNWKNIYSKILIRRATHFLFHLYYMGFRFEFFSHIRNDICIFAVDVLVTFTEAYIWDIHGYMLLLLPHQCKKLERGKCRRMADAMIVNAKKCLSNLG